MSAVKNSRAKVRVSKALLICIFVLVMMGAITVGDVEQMPILADVNENTDAVYVLAVTNQYAPEVNEPSEQEWQQVPPDGRIQLLNFESKKTITDGLRYLSARYKRNIVPSPKVEGKLTVTRLFDVTFQEALEAILGHGFEYEQEGNFIRIYTAEEYIQMKQDPKRKVYRVFTLYYLSAEEGSKLIMPVLSADAQVQSTTAGETSVSDASGSSSTGGGSSSTGSIGSGGGNSLALHDTIVVYDYPENIATAEEIIRALDTRPKQVLVEATILSALLTEGMELGIDLNFMAGVALEGTEATGGTQDAVLGGVLEGSQTAGKTVLEQIKPIGTGTPLEVAGFATVAGKGLRIGISTGDVRVFISALETVTNTTILANPKILAVNKQEGSVLIGTNLGYRSSTTISTGGIATEGEVQFLQTGTQLVFRPYIGNDDYIRMDIYPKDSSATLNEDGVPTENTTQVKTNVIVRDGETIVIGGLFRDVVTTTRNQVPLLGNLPVVGALFRGTTDQTQREEVIVLLTPHIIEKAHETRGRARMDDIARLRLGAKDAMVEVGGGRLAEDFYAKAANHYLDGDIEAAIDALNLALEFRPTYLEALRLKERIIKNTDPEAAGKMERKLIESVGRKDSNKWLRK